MMNQRRPQEIEAAWMEEWVSAGLHEIERYLQKHAAFEEFCRLRLARRPAGE
jgi:hypothetical protein